MANFSGGWLECEDILQKANNSGDLESAQECFQKTADSASTQDERANALIMVGYVLIKQGKNTDALNSFNESARLAKELGDLKLRLRALQFIQHCHQLQGDSKQVQAVAEEIKVLIYP